MFDIGWSELMMIGIVALIVIGPKDLPDMFRTLGRFTSKARGMARDFQRAMESAANETGVKDVAADLKKATSARSMGLDAVKDAASRFEKWDPMAPLKTQAKTAPKPDPDAAPPATAAPLAPPEGVSATGPNTQALAEAQARRRAERTAAAQDGAAARMGPAAEAGPRGDPGRGQARRWADPRRAEVSRHAARADAGARAGHDDGRREEGRREGAHREEGQRARAGFRAEGGDRGREARAADGRHRQGEGRAAIGCDRHGDTRARRRAEPRAGEDPAATGAPGREVR